ncbi:MAG: NADH:ubiquinone oxidoreductase subunit NDUFA12 [Rhodospirillales bacterium 12-54-5]|nr:MAG: NADH:ubiquinone oxidoreductase subunit NDUFA12 [Rhodospirillales bacterium 12-54-5]
MSATIGTKIFTFFQGKYVGRDAFGNRYYLARRAMQGGLKKRWVIYNGLADPSKVPANWHGWLHYTLDAPISDASPKYSWLKPHLPNLTGTIHRYLPQGHILKSGVRAKTTADYQPWQPK